MLMKRTMLYTRMMGNAWIHRLALMWRWYREVMMMVALGMPGNIR